MKIRSSNDIKPADYTFPYMVQLVHTRESQLYYAESKEFFYGDSVIIISRYGLDLGEVLQPLSEKEAQLVKENGDKSILLRMASEQDLELYRENQKKEEKALEVCREKAENLGLDMKLIDAHFLLDEQKIVFFFTAESRVDFRELIKDLASHFKIRIELRQVGPRDESRILGGLAVCGRPFCCNNISDKLGTVSIKMVRDQNLAINSMKISGSCARLLCCIAFEHDYYQSAVQKYPLRNSKIRIKNDFFRIVEVNYITRSLRATGADGRVLVLSFDDIKRDPKSGEWRMLS